MSAKRQVADPTIQRPRLLLVGVAILWKVLLLAVALLSPGIGYDTSTDLFLEGAASAQASWLSKLGLRLATNLVRWDAIYYVSLSHKGYQYEQGWAFGWGLTRVISAITKFLVGGDASTTAYAMMGIVIANISHILSVLVLYELVLELARPPRKKTVAIIASCLHVIAPAGMFLVAPCAESTFSLLNFTGLYCYTLGSKRNRPAYHSLLVIVAGLLFGMASTVRSNGIFNGIMYVYDVALLAMSFSQGQDPGRAMIHLVCLALGGQLAAAGFIVPQAIAFGDYCLQPSGKAVRPWCSNMLPSIYTFVQSHYWNVGFLRYWTVSNLPLFVIALPMLYLMTATGWYYAFGPSKAASRTRKSRSTRQTAGTRLQEDDESEHALRRIALPQLLLTGLAVTNFHVQIITRISVGYPLVYLALAEAVMQGKPQPPAWVEVTVRWMVMYGIIQGGLFASFLPPA